jgi:hypothetical protein
MKLPVALSRMASEIACVRRGSDAGSDPDPGAGNLPQNPERSDVSIIGYAGENGLDFGDDCLN